MGETEGEDAKATCCCCEGASSAPYGARSASEACLTFAGASVLRRVLCFPARKFTVPISSMPQRGQLLSAAGAAGASAAAAAAPVAGAPAAAATPSPSPSPPPSAASASMFNLSELLETTKAMAAGRVFTGYFANPSLHEPIRQDLFVFFDIPDIAAPSPTPPQSSALKGKKGAAQIPVSPPPAPQRLPGGALYWSVVGRDGSVERRRAEDLSLPLAEIEDIYLGTVSYTHLTLPTKRIV